MDKRPALFLDLPNFYSRLLKSGIGEPRLLRDYFLNWLDFDLMARALAGSFSAIWVFYSGQRIGPSDQRIESHYLNECIDRINALEGVTARDVNIPGTQREPVEYKCEECEHEGIGESRSEKGVDTSLTVHLFDTMDYWDVAYLLSGDADFVPAVSSLRRQGNIVIGAGFPDVSSNALVRECYQYIDLCDLFLRDDVTAFTAFKEDGIAYNWLTENVNCDADRDPGDPIQVGVHWLRRRDHNLLDQPVVQLDLTLWVHGPAELASRLEMISCFPKKSAESSSFNIRRIRDQYSAELVFDALVGVAVERRLPRFASSLEGLGIDISDSGTEAEFKRVYQCDRSTGQYAPCSPRVDPD